MSIFILFVKELQDIGVVFLTWRAPDTLGQSLERFSEALAVQSFGDAVVFCQEMTEADSQMAESYGFRAVGNEKNVGILGGMKSAVEASRSENILYLECDCLLVDGVPNTASTLETAASAIKSGELDVMRLRSLKSPGLDYTPYKHLRYWPDADRQDSLAKKLRRLLRPAKARKLIGEGCLVHPQAEEVFPRYIKRLPNGHYCIDSEVLNWTNQSIMFRKDWFLNTIIPYAEAHPSSRTVNGFQDLEKELNSSWWRQQHFKVGWADPGLFTHSRLDRPSGDEKLRL
jgi:hypothetical protein